MSDIPQNKELTLSAALENIESLQCRKLLTRGYFLGKRAAFLSAITIAAEFEQNAMADDERIALADMMAVFQARAREAKEDAEIQ